MRIINIQINEFGPLVNRSFDFGDTLTIINGENESGKSSLLLFIKFALYGLSKRAKASEASELERALSHSTKNASGSMTVSHLGKLYRIDRQIRKSGKTATERVQLTELESGAKCDYGNSPGEFLLGIPAEVFENSCGISQLGCSSVNGEQVGSAIRNLLTSADESIDTEKAIKVLDNVRVKYLHKNKKGGLIYSLSLEEEELSEKYARAVEASCETERLEGEIKKLDDKITDVSAKQQLADELSSKITLRSAIKLFDKLHEFERDKEAVESRMNEIKEKTSSYGASLDRGFVATLNGATNELKITENELSRAREALDNAPTGNAEEGKLLAKINALGGLDALREFFKKASSKAKTFTALTVVFAALTVIFAACGFISPILFVPAGISLILFVIFLVMNITASSTLKKKCTELNVSRKETAEFFACVEKAIESSARQNDTRRQLEAELLIKERMLSTSTEKLLGILKKHGFNIEERSATPLIEKANEISLETATLWDEYDTLSGRLSALNSQIEEISGELSDYNEHQIRGKVSPEILNMTEEDIRKAKKEREYHSLQLKALGEKRRTAENSLMAHRYSTADPFNIASKLSKTSDQLAFHTKKLEALELAIEALEESSANLRNTVAPKIREGANNYMSRITDGKYDSVAISDKLELSMSEEGFSYIIDSFSKGTKDAAYLSLRLSLLSLLGDGETPPLLMDETLAMIDDKRAARLLRMLSEHAKNNGQCILFSCHDREERLCTNESIEFSKIEM